MKTKTKNIFLVSDSTGETIETLTKACVYQFSEVDYKIHFYNFVRSFDKLDQIVKKISESGGIVLCTLIDENLKKHLSIEVKKKGIPYFSILDQFLTIFSDFFEKQPLKKTGLQHVIDNEYYKRIEAVEFSVNYDDGRSLKNLANADIILIGISRTSKTPTSIYLAHRGYKTANVPFILSHDFSHELKTIIAQSNSNSFNNKIGPKIIGLIKNPRDLLENRIFRSEQNKDTLGCDYVDIKIVREEIVNSKQFFIKNNIEMVNVSGKSVEESASIILQKLKQHTNNHKSNLK